MEILQFKSGKYTESASLPVFYIASTEFNVDFNFKYSTTVIGKNINFDKVTVDYSTLSAYGYTTLNNYDYNSETGTLTVDFTVTVNRLTAGAMLKAATILGSVVVNVYLNDNLIKTLTSTLNPTFYIFDKSSASVIIPGTITIPNLTPDYNTYSIEQAITTNNIAADSLTFELTWLGNVDNITASITDSKFNLKWTEYYFPVKYTNNQTTSATTPELNCQFVLTVEGINSKSGRRVSTTAILDKAYNDLLDHISIETKHYIGWQDPSYDIKIDRINNYSATISTTQFIDGNEHSWLIDKQIFNTDSTLYTVVIYSSEIKKSNSGFYRIYFSNGKKVDIVLTKNGYPVAFTPTIRCNFTLPINITEESDYIIKKSNDIRNFDEEIVKGILYPFNDSAYLQLGDIISYYSDNIEIENNPLNITTDTKHSFSWASKSIYKNYIYNITVNNKDYYISPYIDYNNNTANEPNSINLVSFYKKIYKDIPFYISINLDYTTELNLSTHKLSVFEFNSDSNSWNEIWSKENYDVYNGVVHQWFKYSGNSGQLKVVLNLGNSVQEQQFEVVDNLCNNNWGYLYYINSYGGADLIGINCTTQETASVTISSAIKENYSNYKTDYESYQYNKKIQRAWAAKTDLISDLESKNYLSLFTSNTLKLFINDNWYDVNITDTKYTIKTLKNNSYKKFNLSFNLEESIYYCKTK